MIGAFSFAFFPFICFLLRNGARPQDVRPSSLPPLVNDASNRLWGPPTNLAWFPVTLTVTLVTQTRPFARSFPVPAAVQRRQSMFSPFTLSSLVAAITASTGPSISWASSPVVVVISSKLSS